MSTLNIPYDRRPTVKRDSYESDETLSDSESDVVLEESEPEIPYEPETPEEIQKFIIDISYEIIERVIPESPRVLTFEKAGKCLKILGKIWNLSEYAATNNIEEEPTGKDSKEKLMDMEGFVDEYQYLHIEAVDLALTDIRVIPRHFVWLLSANLSGNRLNNLSACPMSNLPNLVALRLNRNRFDDPYLPPMKHLQYLGLNNNKIDSLHRIYHPNLETLDLNYNKIKKLDASDCWKLSKLTQLELRGNQLTTTAGIEYQTLVNLYLAENKITELPNLEILVNLERLHLRDNPLSSLVGFTKSNINLKYLNVRNCKIETVAEVKNLTVLPGLKELIIMGNIFNPVWEAAAKDEEVEDVQEEEDEAEVNELENEEELLDEEVRMQILKYLPKLTRINKKAVRREELQAMKSLLEEEGEEEENY